MEGYGNENPGAFQPTRPLRGATYQSLMSRKKVIEFQPTRPLRGATIVSPFLEVVKHISTHAPLAGRDGGRVPYDQYFMLFQPTRPLRGATIGMRDCRFFDGISTHAPLAGRDQWGGVVVPPHFDFNPRAPCGARLSARRTAPPHARFQPTRPLRGATLHLARLQQALPYFNPRAPCGARPVGTDDGLNAAKISTHAPLAGRDLPHNILYSFHSKFQPTRPLRGATHFLVERIHHVKFQPTRPLRGATDPV